MLGKIISFLYFDIGFKLRYLFWKLIITSSGGKIGRNVKMYEGVRICCSHSDAVNIGSNVRILRNVTISTSNTGKISIGDNVHIGEGTIIFSDKAIDIKNNVVIGPYNVIVDFDHIYKDLNVPISQQGNNSKSVLIEEDVWISSHCSIIKGTTIGKGSVIGAAAVVNKNIPPYSVACGVPARIVKTRGAN